VIKPDDTVIVRVARSEMGQGMLISLCQLVAEELECDWSKVTWEYPTPGQSAARNRVWGDFGTDASRGIRASHAYMRMGGAVAREMLKQAAAIQWKVPVSDLAVAKGVIRHQASNRSITYGKVAQAAASLPYRIRNPSSSRIRRIGKSPARRWRGSRSPIWSQASRSTARI
jgi:isoquinoline 1-oxidoreductase beta subunit